MGCDDHPVASDLVGGAFQSTHPSGVRLVAAVLAWFGLDISIHAPQWGATWMRLAGRCSPGFQSTHPSGVRPRSGRCQPARPRISIHAPQWGATAISATGKDARGDFNPRTPVGCDWMQARGLLRMAYFNPRTPVGCDNPTGLHQPLRSDFNPRTPVGCDAQWSFGRRLQMLFQSTHPSGVRRPSTRRASPTRHFNPRTPVGCDVPVLVLACIGDRISIHAPQWGATSAYHQSPAGALFQSTHPSGVRLVPAPP